MHFSAGIVTDTAASTGVATVAKWKRCGCCLPRTKRYERYSNRMLIHSSRNLYRFLIIIVINFHCAHIAETLAYLLPALVHSHTQTNENSGSRILILLADEWLSDDCVKEIDRYVNKPDIVDKSKRAYKSFGRILFSEAKELGDEKERNKWLGSKTISFVVVIEPSALFADGKDNILKDILDRLHGECQIVFIDSKWKTKYYEEIWANRMPEAIMICVGECGDTVCDGMMNRERVFNPSLPSTSQQTPKAKPSQEQLAKAAALPLPKVPKRLSSGMVYRDKMNKPNDPRQYKAKPYEAKIMKAKSDKRFSDLTSNPENARNVNDCICHPHLDYLLGLFKGDVTQFGVQIEPFEGQIVSRLGMELPMMDTDFVENMAHILTMIWKCGEQTEFVSRIKKHIDTWVMNHVVRLFCMNELSYSAYYALTACPLVNSCSIFRHLVLGESVRSQKNEQKKSPFPQPYWIVPREKSTKYFSKGPPRRIA